MSYNVILDRLHRLYPHLSREDVIGKVEESNDDAFLFFRAFVPLFYQLLRRSERLTELPIGKAEFNCWCVGDPHLENFGVLIASEETEPDSRIFTMNDPDDGAISYPAADLLRFLTGIRLAEAALKLEPPLTIEGKLNDAIVAYRNALNDGDVPLNSDAIKTFLDNTHHVNDPTVKKLLKRGNEIDEDYFSKTGRFRLAKKDDGDIIYGFRVSATEDAAIRVMISEKFPGEFEVCDIRKFKKKNGGSGGLLQFRILLRPNNSLCSRRPDRFLSSEVMVIELKPLVRPGVFPLMRREGNTDWTFVPEYEPSDLLLTDSRVSCSLDPKVIVKRVNESLKHERGSRIDRFSHAFYLPELGPVLMRPQWRGDNGVKMSDVIDDKKRDLIEAEAAILGIIHRNSLDSVGRLQDYKDAFDQQTTEPWLIGNSSELAATMEKIFEEAVK